jgi:hypothetical protein
MLAGKAGSGSLSQWYVSADPDPQHCQDLIVYDINLNPSEIELYYFRLELNTQLCI